MTRQDVGAWKPQVLKPPSPHAPKPSAAQIADLRGRGGSLLEQNPQSRTVGVRLSRFLEEHCGYQIAPAE